MSRVEERLGEMGVMLPNLPTPRIVSALEVLMRELLIIAAERAMRYLEGLNGRGVAPVIPPSLLERGMDGAMKVSHGGKS